MAGWSRFAVLEGSLASTRHANPCGVGGRPAAHSGPLVLAARQPQRARCQPRIARCRHRTRPELGRGSTTPRTLRTSAPPTAAQAPAQPSAPQQTMLRGQLQSFGSLGRSEVRDHARSPIGRGPLWVPILKFCGSLLLHKIRIGCFPKKEMTTPNHLGHLVTIMRSPLERVSSQHDTTFVHFARIFCRIE